MVGAARRMNLSPPAMSRTLSRIRETMGDPIFVRPDASWCLRLTPSP